MTPARPTFHPGLALTAQAGVAFLIVLLLAAWQFGRGLEKTALRNERLARLSAAPSEATQLSPATADFTRVSLTGVFDAERQFFVASRPGVFQVLATLRTDTGLFLVNRGWIRQGTTAEPPALETPTDFVNVVGVIWPNEPLTPLAAQETWPSGWPKAVRALNAERMATVVGAMPREIRLQSGAGVLQPASLAWDDAPGMHWGYAVQWLLIAAAVGIGYVVVGRRRGRRQLDSFVKI